MTPLIREANEAYEAALQAWRDDTTGPNRSFPGPIEFTFEFLEAAGYRVVRQEVVPHIKIAGDDRPLWWDIVVASGETP